MELRKCRFCGCTTNAKLRRCCEKGYREDVLKSEREQLDAAKNSQTDDEEIIPCEQCS